MKIEYTENAELYFDNPEYDILKTGIVIFPDNIEDVNKIKRLKEFLDSL